MYFVYLLRCSDDSLYCGKTTDLKKRLHEHNFTKKAAKYTRSRRPVKLVYNEKFKSLTRALKREWAIKMLTKEEKEKLINK
ncbi:MAG: GIY-YIG nuclease family protein [Patescibacteria group bacterium]